MAGIKKIGGVHTPYVQAPKSLLQADISPAAKVVMLHMMGHQDGFRVSQDSIASSTGISLNATRRSLKELESVGFLERESGARNSFKSYTLRLDIIQKLDTEKEPSTDSEGTEKEPPRVPNRNA